MARPTWADFGSIWKTIREVDVTAIRREAERPVAIAVVGQPAALWHVHRLLREGPDRYPVQPEAPAYIRLDEVARYLDYMRAADLLVLALDAGGAMGAAELDGLRTLSATQRPRQVVLLVGEGAAELWPGWTGSSTSPWAPPSAPPEPPRVPGGAAGPGAGAGPDGSAPDLAVWAPYLDARLALVVDPSAPGAGMKVCGAVLDALPHEIRLAAARRLPGLRPLYAARLTGEVSVSNAAFALASGVPSIVPILGIPIAAADTIVLTKNQVMMVYRLALACGAPADFQKRMMEITPVIGGAIVWRQIAGALVGLVPGYGIVPKTAVAFGGTYVVGLIATRWYETGLLTDAERKRITSEAAARAKDVATTMAAQTRSAGDKAGSQVKDAASAVAVRAKATRESVLSQARDATERVRAAGRKVTRRDKDGAATAGDSPDELHDSGEQR